MLVDEAFVEARLGKFRDEDMDVEALRDYVMVLLKRDEELDELRLTMKAELRDFLADECDDFVDDIFHEIHQRRKPAKANSSSNSDTAAWPSMSKRSKDFSEEDDKDERRTKRGKRDGNNGGESTSSAGDLDYGASLPVAGMSFDPAAMASMMSQMMPGGGSFPPPLSYDAAYTYEATSVKRDKVEKKAVEEVKEVEEKSAVEEKLHHPGGDQGEEQEDGGGENLDESMRGQMEGWSGGSSYARGRGRGRGRGGGRVQTNYRGGSSWRGGRGNYSAGFSSGSKYNVSPGRGGGSSFTTRYVSAEAAGPVVSVLEPATVSTDHGAPEVASAAPDDLYGDIDLDDSRPTAAVATGEAPSSASAAAAEINKKKFEEAKKLRIQAEGVWKQKESLIQGQISTIREMITKVSSSTEKGRGQLDMLEGKIQDLQNKLKDVRTERAKSGSSSSSSEVYPSSASRGRGGRGGRFTSRGRGRTNFVRGGSSSRGGSSYIRM